MTEDHFDVRCNKHLKLFRKKCKEQTVFYNINDALIHDILIYVMQHINWIKFTTALKFI